MSSPKEIEIEIRRIERIEKKNKRYSKRRTNKLKVKRIEREIEEIPTQILNKRCIKKLVKNQNVELRKEYKEFILMLP